MTKAHSESSLMHNVRCLKCGSSRLDRLGYMCARCGGSAGRRSEPCYVSPQTKRKLLLHASELSQFGVKFGRESGVFKNWHFSLGDAIALLEVVQPGTLRAVVRRLRDLAIPIEEILRLRLNEPELILNYYHMDEEFRPGAVVRKESTVASPPRISSKIAGRPKRKRSRPMKEVRLAASPGSKLLKSRPEKRKS
jgi:hypothetical protein